jgi:hypothetical protein
MSIRAQVGFAATVLCAAFSLLPDPSAAQESPVIQYRVLATNKTSTMQKEMDAAAAAGFRFGDVMGGPTAFGGSEVVIIMTKGDEPGNFRYRLLATNKTSTMQKELQNAADEGYEYRRQRVFNSTFGGKEVVVILERAVDRPVVKYEYRLLATSKTSTMEKELSDAGAHGFDLVGMTVAQTAVGGEEVVAILRRKH